MSVALAHPLGLLALAALPAIWWLHHFVLRGPDVPVSCLALWGEGDRTELEGKARRRPPLGLVLVLELVGAAALALLVAGVRVTTPTADRPRVGVVVDRSASMGGGPGGATAWGEVQRLLPSLGGSDVRVVLVGSGPEPAILGGAAQSPAEAARVLAAELPALPDHSLAPAVELLTQLGLSRDELVVFSDRDLPEPRLVRVGKPAENTGIVNATWEAGLPPAVVIRHFGAGPPPPAATLEVDGLAPRDLTIPWEGKQTALLRLEVPADVEVITVRLPRDALPVDDEVVLLRPSGRPPRARIDHPDPRVRRAFERALSAAGAEFVAPGVEADLVVSAGEGDAGASVFRVLVPAAAEPLADPIFVLDRGSPLVEGVDTQGLVWVGRRGARAEHPLLAAGPSALVWREGPGLAMQVDPARSNLFRHPAFALLVANWVHGAAERQGSLVHRNHRVGERLRFAPGPECHGELRLRAPSGRERVLRGGAPVVDAGALGEAGVWRLSCSGVEERVAVNLLDAAEGDLTKRSPDGRIPPLRTRSVRASAATGLLEGILALLALLALCGAWGVLGRRRQAGRAP